jgi:molybdopterin molybdotransferase
MDGFALRANGATFEAGTEFAVQGWQAAGDAGAEGGEGAWEIDRCAHAGWAGYGGAGRERGRPRQRGWPPDPHRLKGTVKPGQNVRLRGQDVSDGERVLQAGQVLDINARTLLHAIGVGEVAVVARPRAAVIATGKELVTEAAQTLESGPDP